MIMQFLGIVAADLGQWLLTSIAPTAVLMILIIGVYRERPGRRRDASKGSSS